VKNIRENKLIEVNADDLRRMSIISQENNELNDEPIKISKKQEYVVSTARVLMEIIYKFDLIDAAQGLINSACPRRVNITKLDFLSYHLESYLNNFIAIFDRCLKLVNQVLLIGLSAEEVRYNRLMKSEEVAENGEVLAAAIEFKNDLKKPNIIGLRITVQHHRTFDDEHYTRLAYGEAQLYENSQKISDLPKALISISRLNREYKKFRKDWTEGIGIFNDLISVRTDDLLNALFAQYQKNIKNLPDK